MNITHFLLQNGFEICQGPKNDFSTMVSNGIFRKYINKQNQIIYFGLHEAYKPPTLITPRPNIKKTILLKNHPYIKNYSLDKENQKVELSQIYDDIMNEALNKFTNEEIFQAMFDKSLILNLDTLLLENHIKYN